LGIERSLPGFYDERWEVFCRPARQLLELSCAHHESHLIEAALDLVFVGIGLILDQVVVLFTADRDVRRCWPSSNSRVLW